MPQGTFLDQSNTGLSSLPEDFADRYPDLEIAFFSRNLFSRVPEVLRGCRKLRILGLKSCQITEVGEQSLPSSLEWLILTDNRINKLPRSIGELKRLKKLALSGNLISEIPPELSLCTELELLRISANKLKEPPPTWLFSLPKLAWCAFASNPFYSKADYAIKDEDLLHISWSDLIIKKKLGESPSSEVFHGVIADSGRDVAVKVFRGSMTSDGWPDADLSASLQAGSHDHLISTLGTVGQHPEDKKAILLEYVGSDFKQVGRPPSFSTITRDVLPEEFTRNTAFVVNTVSSIAAACKHLHDNSLAHGDIYAHNTLANDDGFAKLGDFGAASPLPAEHFSENIRRMVEKVEVRALGYFLDDLLARLPAVTGETLANLEELRSLCLLPEVSARPSFQEICALLSTERRL